MPNRVSVLIRGGLVYDGSGSPPVVADVGIAGDRIAFVGRAPVISADVTVEAGGLAVAPGFIDSHSHSDFTLMADPRAEGKVCQGVTTEINGNCGMSAAPLYKKALERREEDLKELGIGQRWNTLAEYFAILEKKGVGINTAVLAGHGNIRASIVGYEDRPCSEQEMKEMTWLLERTLDEGAAGLSSGLIYPPGIYSDTEELVCLAQSLRKGGLIYASHIRSEGVRVVESVGEVIEIGKGAGVRVHVSHIKTAGRENWGKAGRVIEMLTEARASGVRITCDRYPYTAASTDLDAILPAWSFEGGNEDELERLRSEQQRRRITEELREQTSREGYWDSILISSVASGGNGWMEGMSIAEIGGRLGLPGMDTVFKVLVDEELRVGAIFFSMCEENLKGFLGLPFCMIGSDSSARSFSGPTRKGKPHPRTFGTFPRFLGKYVRQEKLLSLEEAIRKATSLTAQTFGLTGRGLLQEGTFADLVVFDRETIIDRALFEDPFREPEGIRFVFVNGTAALWDGKITGKCAGRVLRSGR
jgi:N-acyl-D-amino-acid deacylase